MTKLTVDEVAVLLWEHGEARDYEKGWEHWEVNALFGRTFEVPGLGEVKVWEHDFNGVETNISWLMFRVGDRTFRKEGQWDSHAGMSWTGPFDEVKPIQKIVTDYEVI